MIKYPSQEIFKPWRDYEKQTTWAPTAKELGDAFETYYSTLQMYPLSFIKDKRSITIKNWGLYRDAKQWEEAGKQIGKIFLEEDCSATFIRSKVTEYYKFFSFLEDIFNLWGKYEKLLSEQIEKTKEIISDIGIRRNTLPLNDRKNAEDEAKESCAEQAKNLLQKHTITLDYIGNWRLPLMRFGTFGLKYQAMMLRKPYINNLPDEILENTEEPYRIVSLINWFLYICGEKKMSIREILLMTSGYKTCKYCVMAYKPKRIDQVTCGSVNCEKAHRNALKRDRRKAGLYKD